MTARPGHLNPAPAIAQARLALLEQDQPPTAKNLARALGIDPRSLHRWRAGAQLHRVAADRLAVRLGFHPLELWPHYYDRRNAA